MEVMERKEAVKLKLPQYFTGKVCKNDHVAYRYTASGGCSACIMAGRSMFSASGPATPEEAAKREQSSEVIKELADVRFRAFYKDVSRIAAMAAQMTAVRYPLADPRMFHVKASPTKCEDTHALHMIRLHPDDQPILQAYAISLFRRGCRGSVLVQQDRARILGAVQQMIENTVQGPYDRDPTR